MPAKKTFGSVRIRGNVTVDGDINRKGAPVPTFKEYIALLSQQGTNPPTATVIKNTLGAEVTFAREDVGYYFAQIPGGFPMLKTICFINGGVSPTATSAAAPAEMDDAITISTTNQSGNFADSQLENASFEVRVYP